jgi:hypothetical protein
MTRGRSEEKSTAGSVVRESVGVISPVVDFVLLFVVVFAAAFALALAL